MTFSSFVNEFRSEGPTNPYALIDALLEKKSDIYSHNLSLIDKAGHDAFAEVIVQSLTLEHPNYPNIQYKLGDHQDDPDISKTTIIKRTRQEGNNFIFELASNTGASQATQRFFKSCGFTEFTEERNAEQGGETLGKDEYSYLSSNYKPKIVDKPLQSWEIAVNKSALAEKLGVEEKATELGVETPG